MQVLISAWVCVQETHTKSDQKGRYHTLSEIQFCLVGGTDGSPQLTANPFAGHT